MDDADTFKERFRKEIRFIRILRTFSQTVGVIEVPTLDFSVPLTNSWVVFAPMSGATFAFSKAWPGK
ncbi:MAG TPA: hypothetical protein VF278_16290 [Pirellulales bacterium]